MTQLSRPPTRPPLTLLANPPHNSATPEPPANREQPDKTLVGQKDLLLERRRKILRLVASIEGVLAFVSIISIVVLILSTKSDSSGYLRAIGSIGLWLGACLMAFWLAGKASYKAVRIGAYLLITIQGVGTFGSLFFRPLETTPNPVLYVILVLVAALLLSSKETLGWMIASLTMLTLNYIFTTFVLEFTLIGPNGPVKLKANPNEATLAFISYGAAIVICGLGLYYFVSSLSKALKQAETRLTTVEQISDDREQKRQLGLGMCDSVTHSSLQLAQTAREQSVTNSQLAQAVGEVANGMSELTRSALNIANTAQEIDSAVQGSEAIGQELQGIVRQTEQTSLEGRQVVKETLAAIYEVDQRIVNLEQKLDELAQNNSRVNQIINLINNIASETHLLALNAAIESAGAGQYGARFAVVAGEVKQLANRILQAAREVRTVIGNAQTAVEEAALAAKEGTTQTSKAVQVASRSGQVIEALGAAVSDSWESVQLLNDRRQRIAALVNDIASATQEQQYATQQVLTILEQVSQTSYETASVIQQISTEASSLQQLSSRLNQALVA